MTDEAAEEAVMRRDWEQGVYERCDREDAERERWRYRVVYTGGDGAMALYFTNDKRDARSVADARGGHVEGPLGDNYWGPRG